MFWSKVGHRRVPYGDRYEGTARDGPPQSATAGQSTRAADSPKRIPETGPRLHR